MAVSRSKNRKELDSPEVETAKQAVAQYEEIRTTYDTLIEQFNHTYPEAASEMQSIRAVGDTVREAISAAKRAIAAAKVSIGDFKCQRKFSQAGYDPDLVIKICVDTQDQELLFELFKSGVIKKVSFDRDAATLFFETRPMEKVATAWVDKQEMTPAVYTPEFTE